MSNKFITLDEAKKRLLKNLGNEYELIKYSPGKYNHSLIRHKTCGKEYEVENQQYFNGKGKCPVCSASKYTKEDIQKIINNLLDDSYIVLEYISKRKPIKIFHTKCGNEISLYLGNIQKGQKCKICECGYKNISIANSYNTDTFKKYVSKKTDNKLEFIDSYTGYRNISKFHCNTCNHDFYLKPSSFTNGVRCPFCKASSGEQIITTLLDKHNIKYEFQKQVKIDSKIYKFDFFLNDLNTVIEFDGSQHSRGSFSKTKDGREKILNDNKRRDAIKDKYCQDNKINIIRIPYSKITKINEVLISKNIYSSTTIESTSDMMEASRVDSSESKYRESEKIKI